MARKAPEKPCSDEVEELPALPDEMLVKIFSHLRGVKQLLQARAVSRRWRDLLARRESWAGCYLSDTYPFVKTAMRVAPGVGFLNVSCWASATPGVLKAAGSTRCAARRLSLVVRGDPAHADLALGALRNQMALGWLRNLALHFRGEGLFGEPTARVEPFLALVGSMDRAKLSDLTISSDLSEPLPSVSRTSAVASLVRLSYKSQRADPLLGSLLAAHRSTLRRVELLDVVVCSEEVFSLLAECPNLRSLSVPLVRGLARLPVSRLTHLHVTAWAYRYGSPQVVLADLRPVFRDALEVEELILEETYDRGRAEIMVGLVAELASSGRSALRALQLRCISSPEGADADLELLAQALLGLPRLVTLSISFQPSRHLLHAISPESAPSLRVLAVESVLCEHKEPCLLPALRSLLARNPLLHVSGAPSDPHSCRNHRKGLACCRRASHPVVQSPAGKRRTDLACAFFAHAEDDRCAYHAGGATWVRLW